MNKMAKAKTIFVCDECGYESAKWLGKCPGCNSWNSFFEEKITTATSGKNKEKKSVEKEKEKQKQNQKPEITVMSLRNRSSDKNNKSKVMKSFEDSLNYYIN